MGLSVRRSLVAGQWYPGAAPQLERSINELLSNVTSPQVNGEIIGLISPHAGYVYSGQTAAYAYNQVRDARYDVVVILSPLHRLPLGRFAVNSASAYETPLGIVPVDVELVAALRRRVSLSSTEYDGEHSIEIQLPFLQVVLGDVNLLPIMIGSSSFNAAVELGTALAEILADRRALVVASTDLHHIDDHAQVVRRDKIVIDAIASFDIKRIRDALSPRDCSVCGRIPVYAMLTAARALGADSIDILYHTTSGDVTGMRTPGQYTVGYLAAAVYRAA